MENTTFTWSYSSADTYLSGYNSQTSNIGNLLPQQIFNSNYFRSSGFQLICEGETKTITFTVNPKPSVGKFLKLYVIILHLSDISGNIKHIIQLGYIHLKISGGSNGTGSTIPGCNKTRLNRKI